MLEGLYPLKFHPVFKEKIWGGQKLKSILNKDIPAGKFGESWELSGVDNNLSIVKNGFLAENSILELIEIYMGELVGDTVYERFGIDFPLLIKFIDANADLSIQVHPSDELAMKRHEAYGKTEMWYIIQADNNSKLFSGFTKEFSEDFYLEALLNKTMVDLLNTFEVSQGDAFYIPAGRVHAIGSGILLAEIQQTSDLTYRIYDYDRLDDSGKPRELNTELAIDAIDFKQYDNYKIKYEKDLNNFTEIIATPYFTTNIIKLTKEVNRDYFSLDSFVIYICLQGKAIIDYDDRDQTEIIEAGEVMLIPASIANINLKPLKETEILEVYINL